MTKRLIAVLLAFVMLLSSVSVMAFAADYSDKMSIRVEMLKNVNGNWVDAGDYVTAGEDVKVRVTIGTDFYCGGGDMLFFYSTDFFTDSYGADSDLAINDYYAGAPWYFYDSTVQGSSATGNLKSKLLNKWNCITQDEYDKYSLIYAELSGSNTTNEKFSADEWLCEFNLHVIDTITSGTGEFLVIPGTVASLSNPQGRFDLSMGNQGATTTDNISMFNRDTAVTYLDNALDSVELLADPVTLTFDAGSGSFTNSTVYSYYGPADAAFSGVEEDPTRSGYTFGGWALADAPDTAVEVPSKFPAADADYVAVWNASSTTKTTLVITTKFFREEDGQWVETNKAKRGDTLKARVYLGTDYGTDSGEIVFFYDNDFFEDNYSGNINALALNTANENGTPVLHAVDGSFVTSASASTKVSDMVANGLISQKFANDNNYFYAFFSFGEDSPYCNTDYLLDDALGNADSTVDDDYWFMEFDLTVKEGATDLGKLFTVAGTERAPGQSTGVIDVPKIDDSAAVGGTDKTYSMMYWVADVKRFENPVELKSTVTFDANTGAFADSTTEYVIENYIGTPIDTAAVPIPSKTGATFIGWYDSSIDHDATRDDVVDVPSEIPYDDVTYKALWVNDVTVSFETFGGTEIEDIIVTPGEAFAPVAAPAKAGYIFLGWSSVSAGTNGGTEGNILTDLALPAEYPSEDTTYYAVWDTGTVHINYYVTTGTSTKKVADRTSEFGKGIPTSGIFTVPAGYELDGWYYDIICSAANKVAETDVSDALEINLYAKMNKGTYDAVFNANGGEFADGSDSVAVPTEYLADIIVPASPTREGYKFDGWDATPSTMDSKGKTFNATWEALSYEFKFICDGEEIFVTSLTVEDDMEVPADEYKEGYTFIGWNQDADATVDEVIPAKAPAENRTYYAIFTPDSGITVTWDANTGYFDEDASGDLSEGDVTTKTDDNVTMDSAVTFTGTAPVKDGYTLLGWSENSTAIVPDAELVVDSAEGKTFYAVWSKNTTGTKTYYLCIYEMGVDGTYPEENAPTSKVTYNDGVAGTTKQITYTPATGFTVDNTEGRTVLTGIIPESGNLILKVYLVRESHVFKAISNGTEFKTTDPCYYGAVIANPGEPDAVTGYKFLGWSVTNNALGEGTADYEFPVIMAGEDITVYAVFEKASYTVTFNAGEGTFEATGLSTETASVEYRGTISKPAAEPVRSGYKFEGWAKSGSDTVIESWNETMGAEDVEYTAVWTKNSFNVEFKVPERDTTSATGSGYGTLTAKLADYVAYGEPQTVAYQGIPTTPAEPVITYYEFMGWSTDGENVLDTLPAIEGDTTFYAVFAPEKIYLIAREGSSAVIDRGEGKYGDAGAYNYATRTRTVTAEPGSQAGTGDVWYVYGLEIGITADNVKNVFCDVHGDGRMEFETACTSGIPGIEPGIGTATKLTVVSNITNEVVETFYLVVFGDVDGDGIISADDTSVLKAEVASVTSWSSFDSNGASDTAKFMAGDIDDTNCGMISGEDVTAEKALVSRYMVIDQITGEMDY